MAMTDGGSQVVGVMSRGEDGHEMTTTGEADQETRTLGEGGREKTMIEEGGEMIMMIEGSHHGKEMIMATEEGCRQKTTMGGGPDRRMQGPLYIIHLDGPAPATITRN